MPMKTCIHCQKQAHQGDYCYACAKARYRAKNKIKAGYACLRDSAKRRGKDFGLTLEEYATFVAETDYFKNKGTKSKSLHIDRIDETRGYSIDNIQVLTNCENTRKYFRFLERINKTKALFTVITIKPEVSEYTPF